MEISEELLEKLKTAVNGGQEFWEQSGTSHLEYLLEYITDTVYSTLEDVLQYLIEERHKVEESENRFVIHYTSIATLGSMLKDAFEDEQEKEDTKPKIESPPINEKSYLRLYDSVHLNDPDEGNYFSRNLNLSPKYDWLKEKDVRHAYITSFILPNSENDMSDNLIFWRTYGQEGGGCSLSLPIPRSRLQKVLYGSEEVKSTAEALMPVLNLLDPLLEIDNSLIREQLAEIVWKALERIRYLYKSEAYRYEQECRFVLLESDIEKDKIRFEYQDRNNSPRIRHYYEHEALQIKNLLQSGSSITFGPSIPVEYRDNLRYYIEELKRRELERREKFPFAPEVKFSDISYRKF